jgi:predicted ATP-binding protein involved in virulence
MRVLRLELSNVRQFPHKRLEFGPGFNLLVGENGAGKSTVLRSLLSALGNAENFKLADRLSDEDIRHRTQEFRVKVEFEAGGANSSVEIERQWRGSSRRKGRVPEAPIIWFGANEAIAAPLRGQKIRRYRSTGDSKYRERDDFREREEFLYREEFMDPPDEHEHADFGRSEIVRRFVGRVLSEFSEKFEEFGWRFVPYDCLVHAPDAFPSEPQKAAAFRREIQAEIMRFLDYERPMRRYRGWGSRRSVKFKANGQPAEEKKPIRSMPEFRDIFERVGKRLEVRQENIHTATIELKLAPRISVVGRDGPLLLSQLSDGEKRIFSMIVDIARQLSRGQGGWRHLEEASGIVVIDEIDCHLHPRWQRMIVKALEDLFPGCQFIATTHSPFIVQAVDADQLQSLGSDPLPGFTDRGIEEIAVKVMGIEDAEVSPRYLELLDVAKEYFAMIEQAKPADGEQRETLRRRMRELTGRYVRNPAFQAFLELKGEAALGSDT